MAGLCEGGNEPPGSLKAISKEISIHFKRERKRERERERERERGKNTLGVEEAASIPKAKSVLSNIQDSLAFLKAHFSELAKYTE
ncbi:hypothetical protein ANN_15357 [Periplaneta americana]|uniref:Uncharacterized protein n=1 Tax=Periplaneta americana TaxID=6978 RepID=A0ABQ8SH43_PERAM|nr:hypothetical protein ANN_15357 [Periplaneta americana]